MNHSWQDAVIVGFAVLLAGGTVPSECFAVPASEGQSPYRTPQAVFDEYTSSIAKRDWRAGTYCVTADLRDAAVCDAFVGAMEHADED